MELPVVEAWFRTEATGGGVTRLVEAYVDELIESNVWHVRGRDADLVVDAANGIGPLRPQVAALAGGRPLIAAATHGHFDHVGGLREFEDRRLHADDTALAATPMPMRLRRADFTAEIEEMYAYYEVPMPEELVVTAAPFAGFDPAAWTSPAAAPTRLLAEGDVVDLGDRRFTVLHTPGHTAGSVCLFEERSGVLFSGDAVYVDGKLSWDDPEAFAASLRRIRELPVRRVHAGHGRTFDRVELMTAIDVQLRELER